MVPNSVASCTPMEGDLDLRDKDGGNGIIGESASDSHAVEDTPAAQEKASDSGKQQSTAYGGKGYEQCPEIEG